ncbi:ABC transporter ATP-binding protein/permease [Mycoplasmatota bacterium]|nr:ABC transporter ATP-binding protein/permease [Mycoplasmatota bacterium]
MAKERTGRGGPRMHGPGPKGIAQKPKSMKAAFSQLLKYLKPYQFILLLVTFFAIASTVFNILGPKLIGDMTDIIQEGVELGYANATSSNILASISIDAILNIVYILISFYILSFIFNLFQGILIARTTQKITKQLRKDLYSKIDKLPLSYFDRTSYGDTLSRMTNDVDLIGQTLNNSISQFVTSVALLLGITIMMFTINVVIALISILLIPLSMVMIRMIMKTSQKYFRSQQKVLGQLNGHIEETYSGQQILKVYQAEGKFLDSFDTNNKKLYENAWKSQFLSGMMMPITRFISNLSYVAIAVVGGIFAVNGTLGIGGIQSLLMYNRRLNQPLGTVAQSMTQIQSALAASERVFEFLKEEEMPIEESRESINSVKGAVSFKHVKFGYEKDKTIIHDFNLEVKPGQKVAIVGPTGAGKTTLVNLVMRFYDIDAGQITIDGIDTTKMTRHDVHQLFGMVLQDTWLFEGTIMDNLKYGRKSATDEEVYGAAKTANVHHFIKSQPFGYDMILKENSNISQGQRQLLTIARAMVSDAPMLILDEATSSVDVRTEQLIQDAMDELMKGRTTFVIAHRLSTIKNADVILVLKDGNVVETGTHDTLLEKNGFYADLYNSQFEV